MSCLLDTRTRTSPEGDQSLDWNSFEQFKKKSERFVRGDLWFIQCDSLLQAKMKGA